MFDWYELQVKQTYVQNNIERQIRICQEIQELVDIITWQIEKWKILFLSFIQKPEINDYWSTNALLKRFIFNEAMARNRYQAIMEFLHFNDNSNYNHNDPARDKLYKICPVIEYLVHRFETMYTPEKNVSIHEELLLFNGRYVFN